LPLLGGHLGYVFVRERKRQIPAHRQQDHLTRIVTSFEGFDGATLAKMTQATSPHALRGAPLFQLLL
jgi:hypothetical protein